MLLANFIAVSLLLTVTAVSALDSRPVRLMLHAVAQWRRRRRSSPRRSSAG